MKTTCLLALMVLVSAASVSAADDKDKNDDSKTSATSDKDKDKNDPNKVICRTDHSTSSRVEIRRTCLTRKQWSDLASQTRKDVNDFENRMNKYQAPTNPNQGFGGGVSPN